jgi:hypothetical protein
LEAVDCSKNTRNYQHTRRPIQDSSKVHSHHHKNLKCHILFLDSKTGFPACSIQTCIQCPLIRVTPFSVHYLYYVYQFPLVSSCFRNTVTRHQMCYHSLLMVPLSNQNFASAHPVKCLCPEKEMWASERLYVEIHDRYLTNCCTFSLKDGRQRFDSVKFSFVRFSRPTFMQHFVEYGLARKVQFQGHVGAPTWHLLISSFGALYTSMFTR